MAVVSVGAYGSLGTVSGPFSVPRSPLQRGSAKRAPLENYAGNAAPPLTSDDAGRSRRARRYRWREALWEHSVHERVRKCGRVLRGDLVGVRSGPGGGGFSGLCTCGSPWADPVCNSKIMWRRSVDLGVGLARHYAAGGSAIFMTRTIRHHRHEPLEVLWDAVLAAWRSMTMSAGWKRSAARLGVVGHVRVVEVTDGDNGWHVHIHAVVLLSGAVGGDSLDAFAAWSAEAWSRAVVRQGRPAPLAVAQHLRLVTDVADAINEYVTKVSDLGLELTQTQSKVARGAHKTLPVWEHLRAFAEDGDLDALKRWHQWERGAHGRKQMTWSRGLRDRLGLGRDLADEEIVTEEVGDADLLWITAEGWRRVVRSPGLQSRILDAADVGPGALRSLLDLESVAWMETRSAQLTDAAVTASTSAHPGRATGEHFLRLRRERELAEHLAATRSLVDQRRRPRRQAVPEERTIP